MTKKLIEELKEIRVRLIQIYMELGNPKDCAADTILNDDIKRFEERDVSDEEEGKD
jgi:uncharacterized membrane protein